MFLKFFFAVLSLNLIFTHFDAWGMQNETEDIHKTLSKCFVVKEEFERRIETHEREFKRYASTYRHAWQRKIKANPRARYHYHNALLYRKKLGEVEKWMKDFLDADHLTQKSIHTVRVASLLSADDLFKELTNDINRHKAQFNKSLETPRRQQHLTQVGTSQFNTFFWGFMAVAVFSQSHIVPVAGYIHQTKTDPSKKGKSPETQCALRAYNYQRMAIQESPVYPIEANAHALKGSVTCGRTLSQTTSFDFCMQNVIKRWPDYFNTPEIIRSFYEEVKTLGGGGSNDVYEAVIRHPRANLPVGSRIALRVTAKAREARGIQPTLSSDLRAYSKLSILRNYRGNPITEHYPQLYGVYHGPQVPWKESHPSLAKVALTYTEMEYVDTFFDTEYVGDRKIPDNVIFEQCLGEWAAQKVSQVFIADSKWRHYGLTNVDYYRVYHIGKDIYLFKPGKTPKRIDWDRFGYYSDEQARARYNPYFVSPEYAQSENGRMVLEEMAKDGIFTVFSKYFSGYKVSAHNPIPIAHPLKHYYVPWEYLDNM